jgi:hypothetical protein
VNLLNCVYACASGDTTCTNNCESSYPSGVTPLVTYLDCGTSCCSTSCN